MVITVLHKDEKDNHRVADIFHNQLCVAPAPSFPLSGWAHPSEQWQMPCPGLLVWAWASALDVSPTASLPQTALPSGAVVPPLIFHPWSWGEWSSDHCPGANRVFCMVDKWLVHGDVSTGTIGSALGSSSFQGANLPTRFGSLWKWIFLNCWWIPLFVVWQPCNFERKYGNYGFSPQNYDKSAKTALDSAQVSNARCPHLRWYCTSRCSEPERLGANHRWVVRSGTGGRVIQTGRMCQQPHVQLLYSEMGVVSDEAMQ